VSCWLYHYKKPLPEFSQKLTVAFFVIQIFAGLYAVFQDINRPFSNLYQVNSLMNEVSAGQQVVTDYWALNAVSAYRDQQLYCIDLRKKASFILWGSDLKQLNESPNRYYAGAKVFFAREHTNQVYMISTGSPEALKKVDSLFFSKYNVELVDERVGTIEKG